VRDVIPQKCSIRIQVAAAAALAINGFTKDKSCDWCVHFQLLEKISSGLYVDDGVVEGLTLLWATLIRL
jgi:hypothetical protein